MNGEGECPLNTVDVGEKRLCLRERCEWWLSHNNAVGTSLCVIKGICVSLESIAHGLVQKEMEER